MKLTKRQIDNASCDDNKAHHLWDDSLAGFGVKLLPSGAKRYVVKYRSYGGGRSAKQRWVTIGTHGQIPFDQAKEHARQILAAVKRGADPQGERLAIRGAPKLLDAWEKFEREELANKKPATIRDYTSCWERHIGPRLGNTKAVDVSRSDVGRLHQSLSNTPYLANRMLALLSSLMNRCEAWEWREQGTNLPLSSLVHGQYFSWARCFQLYVAVRRSWGRLRLDRRFYLRIRNRLLRPSFTTRFCMSELFVCSCQRVLRVRRGDLGSHFRWDGELEVGSAASLIVGYLADKIIAMPMSGPSMNWIEQIMRNHPLIL